MSLDQPSNFEILSIENLETFYAANAVHLEGFIKGSLTGEAPQRRCTFDALRTLVKQSKKLINGVPTDVEEPDHLTAALQLIDYFDDTQNAQTMLNHFDLESYRVVKQSFSSPENVTFASVDDQILPDKLAEKWAALISDFRVQLEQAITVTSGYRSPAYQLYLMVTGSYRKTVIENGALDLKEIFSILAPPYCSKHSIPDNPAIDIKEFFPGQPGALGASCDEIRQHPAWQAFKKLAEKHGFHENYPSGSRPNHGAGESWEFQYRQS